VREAITLRVAVDEDEIFLYELYASTRRTEMALLPWPPEAKRGFLRMQFEAQTRHYRSAYPGASHSIVLTEESLAGRLYVDRRQSEILIVDFTLLPEFQGRGIGRALVSELQSEAAAAGRILSGHVGKWSPAGVFWRHMGFEVAKGDEMYDRISWSRTAAT
jgi:GNAT superfamily N-acetyltransferase